MLIIHIYITVTNCIIHDVDTPVVSVNFVVVFYVVKSSGVHKGKHVISKVTFLSTKLNNFEPI